MRFFYSSFLFLAFILFFLCSFVSFAITQTSMMMTFSEQGSVVHYYNKYHVVDINGTVTITNPTSASYFGINIPFKNTVLNYKQIMTPGDTQYISGNNIFIVLIGPNQSISFNYVVTGITNINPVVNGSIMEGLIDTENILSFNDIRVSLLKSEIENVSAGGHPNTRAVTVRVENPTGVDVEIDKLQVIKTPSINITDILQTWTFPLTKPNILVPANGVWEDDIYDRNAHDGEVYWVNYDVEIYRVLFTFNSQSLMQINITLMNQFNNTQNITNITDQSQYVFILKELSSSVVQPGDIVNVLLTILNTGNIPAFVNIADPLPKGFQFYTTPSGNVDGNIFKDSQVIGAGQTIQLNYSIKYVGDGTVGMGFFDGATVSIGDKNVSSGKVSFIKEYLSNEKLFVQKKVTHLNDNDVQIDLILKNIGQSVIQNVVLKEPLTQEDRFELISRSALEKGVWSIPEINPNDEFEVEYVTGSDTEYNILPNIFGLADDEVYKTLITDTILKNIFTANKISSIEIVGIASVFVFIVAMFFINLGFLEKLKSSVGNKIISLKTAKVGQNISKTGDAIKNLKADVDKNSETNTRADINSDFNQDKN